MHNTKGKEWLLERVDRSQWDRKTLIEPMLATAASEIPASSDQYLYEVKWDGIRVILYIDEEGIKILSRSGRDITAQFPEMVKAGIISMSRWQS